MSYLPPDIHPRSGRGHKLTLMEVSSRDAVAFTARLLIIMTWLILIAIYFSIAGGGRIPKESPAEMVLGIAFITAALLTVIAIRRNAITRRMSRSVPVPAKIFHSAHVQFFITVGLVYEWRGREFKRTIQVPVGKTTKFLKDREEVILLVDPEKPEKVIIGDVWGIGKA